MLSKPSDTARKLLPCTVVALGLVSPLMDMSSEMVQTLLPVLLRDL